MPRNEMICLSQVLQDEEYNAADLVMLPVAGGTGSSISFLHASRNSKLIRVGTNLMVVVVYKCNPKISKNS
jgi:hypothetical protein